MKEFEDFIARCYDTYIKMPKCNEGCPLDRFCKACQCEEGDCTACLKHIQFDQPRFTYSCKKITYHYVLQFFNRFASEIALLLKRYPNNKTRRVTCASLGCGPGSEVFGIIKAWKDVAPNFTLDYQGYDQSPVWNDVQSLSKEVFANSPHTINFYTTDMFCDWQGGKNVDILILNYLLSDAVKFQTSNQKQKFLEDIRDFCIDKRVRSIIFNDIRFYGNDNRLNSGFQMVIRLVELLKNATLCNNSLESIRCIAYASPSDNYARGCKWKVYRSDNLVFPLSEKNRVVKCNSRCRSKQVFIVLKHK